MSDEYDVAQICLNGHVVNEHVRAMPQSCSDYCEVCGAETITKCPSCQQQIRGQYEGCWGGYEAPPFCISCGKGFPWTEAKISAAAELADELERFDHEDRDLLRRSLDDLLADTPRTQVAAVRFKRLMVKAGKESAEAFRQILVDVLSETAKKAIWG